LHFKTFEGGYIMLSFENHRETIIVVDDSKLNLSMAKTNLEDL